MVPSCHLWLSLFQHHLSRIETSLLGICLVSFPRVRGVWFRLWGFFNQWTPITEFCQLFSALLSLKWLWSKWDISSFKWDFRFFPKRKSKPHIKMLGFFKHEPRGNYSRYWNLLTHFSAVPIPRSLSRPPWFFPHCFCFAAVEKLSQRAAAGIFHPSHPYSGFSGWSYWNTSGPSVTELCLVPAVFKVMQSLYFSLLIVQHDLKFMLVMPQPLKKDLVKWHLLLKAQNII